MAKRVHVPSAVLIGSLLHAGAVSALGLGDITLNSFLNEPLDAEVTLIDTRDLVADEIKVRLAGVDEFERFGVDRNYFLTRIQFDISIDRERNTGVIRLTTQEPVREPFVDLIIEARWPAGRLLREYTVLVDPPVFREEPLVVSASERVAAVEQEAAEAATPPGPAPEKPVADTVGGSGDRLATRRSELPEGEMPEREFSAATADTPEPGRRYMVRRDETLWQIAERGRPQGSSVQQAMLDIQRLNPEAFIDGNINRIKAGYIIYLPSAGDISSDDLSEALAEVRQQNADWADQRASEPGVTAAASLRISADSADAARSVDEGDESDRSETRVADASGAASRAAGSSADDGGESAERSDGRVDGGEAASVDSGAGSGADSGADSELADQIAAMTERLDTLEQVVALKDERIASLEQSLREARAAAQEPEAPASPTSEEPAVTPAPATAPAASTTSAPEQGGPGFWLYAAGAALVAALLGALFWRRRRNAASDGDGAFSATMARGEASEDVFAGVTLRDEPEVARQPPVQPVQAARAAPEESQPAAQKNNRGYGERRYDDYIDDAGAGDALAEADIYIAYGRYLQAAELLTTAIEGEPGNTAYRLKLIELYVDMGESTQAQEQLDALRELADADAVRRGEAIVSGSAAPIESGPEPAVNAAPESAPPVADADATPAEEEIEYEPLELSLDDLPRATEDSGPTAPDNETLDLELDFDELTIEEDQPAAGPGMQDDDELDLSEALREPATDADTATTGASGDERDSEEMVFAADADQVATRLDLARAYLDMGDDDGARRILDQVVSEGSPEQQSEARALLERIG